MTPDKLLYLMDEMIKIDGEDLMRLKPSTAPLEALLAFNSRRMARTPRAMARYQKRMR
jgi:hypothetical protein